MYKTIYDHAAEIAQDVIKARGEAINGEKELIETYLSDEAVTKLYKKIFRVLCEPINFYCRGEEWFSPAIEMLSTTSSFSKFLGYFEKLVGKFDKIL